MINKLNIKEIHRQPTYTLYVILWVFLFFTSWSFRAFYDESHTCCKWDFKQVMIKKHFLGFTCLTIFISNIQCVCMCVCVLSHVWFFATPWTLAHQAPLPMGIYQARILEWVAMPSARWSSQPRDPTCVSCIAGKFCTTEPPGKPHSIY